ncbi:MAG: L-histidine N(alpha)-methyltransferase [Steroidobacteraceae bacterium]
MASTNFALADRFTDGVYDEGLSEVLRGLLYIPRQLSHTWLYDERGSRLFEKICELPEYYLTGLELAIMRAHAPLMAAMLDDDVALIEFGSGDSAKIRPLFDALPRLRAYVPIDIAASSLARAARAVQREYPAVKVLPLCADFSRKLELPVQVAGIARRVVYFSGSTLGNYEPVEAVRLLGAMRTLAGDAGAALVAIDLAKERSVLEPAYDDAQGVTAEFNLNALRHVNRRLGVGFEVSHFRHRAVWMEAEQRIEMHLVSAVNQSIRIGAAVIRMLRGDFIRTECSHKYTPERFAQLAAQARWNVQQVWTDERGWFSVQLLTPA